jgi:S-DNA-T family DNA segregation ATPase FtsK/SpoIIIE
LAKTPKNLKTFSYGRELIVVTTLGFAVFYYLALFSFHPFDSSLFSASTPKIPIKNFAGSAGAFLAASAYYYFGVLSFLLMVPVVYSSFQLEAGKKPLLKILKIFAGWSVVCLVAAVVSTTFIGTIDIQKIAIPTAGLFGVEAAKLLFNIFGSFGVWIFLGTALLIVLVLFRRLTVSKNVIKAQEEGYSRIKSASQSLGRTVGSSFASNLEKGRASLAAFRAKNDPYQVNTSSAAVPVRTLAVEPQSSVASATPLRVSPQIHAEVEMRVPQVTAITTEEEPGLAPEQEEKLKALDQEMYEKPSSAFFVRSKNLELTQAQEQKLRETGDLLVRTFVEFGVKGSVIAIQPGPVVTVFEFRPDAGVKQSKIQGLVDDLALALRVPSVFIEPVFGKRALGIQVPNQDRQLVHFGDVVGDESFLESNDPLMFAVGKSIDGTPVCTNLSKMPHLLIAGATGAGKSVAINTFICSVILKSPPEEVRMILVDPKMLELSVYEGIPHLLMPVVTESKRAAAVLKWAVHEMETRYQIMQQAKVRGIDGFNKFWANASRTQKAEILTKLEETDKAAFEALSQIEDRLPYILIIIDELADLMLTAPKEVESLIQRLAQKARASGIHMVLATQRPSVEACSLFSWRVCTCIDVLT